LKFSEQSTQGYLDIDGASECFTLEPRKDQSQGKPYCIPCGTYPVTIEWSPRFERNTPHLQDVPGFENVEIHPGNFPHNTEGCTLVGHDTYPDTIGRSIDAFDSLMQKLSGQSDISITYLEETQ
jgi:hypothetical protein